MTRVFFVRHAEVAEQYHRVFGGRLDIELSDRGREQSQVLARWLNRFSFDAIYASPMQRVRQTLDPFLSYTSVKPKVAPDFREVDFGDWTGMGWHEVQDRFGQSAFDWLHQLDRGGFPNGESAADLRLRVGRSWLPILADHADQTIAIFAHGGVIRMLLAMVLDLPITAMEKYEVDYASVSWIDLGHVKAGRARTEIQLLNFTPWRDMT